MPQCPYIFNVYLLILTPAYNAHSLVPASRIPFLSSSCSIYFGIAYSLLHSHANFFFGVDCFASTIQAANDATHSLTFIVPHSIMTL